MLLKMVYQQLRIRHFETKGFSQMDLKESSVRGWKKLYCDTVSSQSRKGNDKSIKELPK